MRKPKFPLIEDNIFKDEIVEFWDNNKQVPFAYLNNCVGCFHRNPILLKHLSIKEPIKFSEKNKTIITFIKNLFDKSLNV
jgi:hypothetical protein